MLGKVLPLGWTLSYQTSVKTILILSFKKKVNKLHSQSQFIKLTYGKKLVELCV